MRDIASVMTAILACLVGTLFMLSQCMTKKKKEADAKWLPCKTKCSGKRAWEVFNLWYSIIWIGCFAAIVSLQLYEDFDKADYMIVCGGLCIPILLSPFVFYGDEAKVPVFERFGTLANIWMAIYSFIGNYWYTHYFYSVLGASYTMPAWRLNDVPVQMYFATFFYFCFYHTLSNIAIRRVVSVYKANSARLVFLVMLVLCMSYFTAFMETLTISSYPYYSFKDRYLAYTLGSAFYGIYFVVSYPMFYRFGESSRESPRPRPTLWGTCVDSLGCGMLILLLLDFTRLAVGAKLELSG